MCSLHPAIFQAPKKVNKISQIASFSWVLSAPEGPMLSHEPVSGAHVGPMNLAIWDSTTLVKQFCNEMKQDFQDVGKPVR